MPLPPCGGGGWGGEGVTFVNSYSPSCWTVCGHTRKSFPPAPVRFSFFPTDTTDRTTRLKTLPVNIQHFETRSFWKWQERKPEPTELETIVPAKSPEFLRRFLLLTCSVSSVKSSTRASRGEGPPPLFTPSSPPFLSFSQEWFGISSPP